jgi:hypothetical protein
MVHIGILCLHRLIQESYEVKMALVWIDGSEACLGGSRERL